MFFLHELERVITLHPSFFGPNIKKYISDRLIDDIEGQFSGQYYICLVMDNNLDISEGKLVPGSGHAEYTVHYKALVWKPFKGEVVDGLVSGVVDTGFFVDVGPLNCFVAKAMIPGDVKFDANATPAQWTNNDDINIEKGGHVRIKIMGLRFEIGQFFAIATIKEDYLGSLT